MDVKLDPLFKQRYEEFIGLELSENNANEAIKRAQRFTITFYFQKYCPADIQINVYTKLIEAYNMIGDRANADKYTDKIEEIREIDERNKKQQRIESLFKEFVKLELSRNNAEEAIKLASELVQNWYFLNKYKEKKRDYIYAKLAKAYYLKDDYENAYKYLRKNTGIVYIKDEDQNRIEILNSACDYYQEKELMEICYDVYYKLGKLSEAEYRQYTSPEREAHFQKVLKETDPNKITKEEFELLFDRFETLDLSKNNKKDAKEAIELASKFMNIPIFNKLYDTQSPTRSDIYGKLGEAYYIVGEYCNAIINLTKTGRLEEDGKLKELYDKSYNELPKIYMALKEIDKCTNEIGNALVEDPLNFDMQ